jgi:hypothetical protein
MVCSKCPAQDDTAKISMSRIISALVSHHWTMCKDEAGWAEFFMDRHCTDYVISALRRESATRNAFRVTAKLIVRAKAAWSDANPRALRHRFSVVE